SQEFQQLSAEAGKLKGQIEGVEKTIDAYAKSGSRGLAMVTEAAQGLAAGMAIAQGAAGLLGDENEDLQRVLLKVQSATALLMGVQQAAELINARGVLTTKLMTTAQNAYTAAIGASTGALRLFKIALVTTGIGAVVVALGVLAQKLFSAKDATEDATDAQKKYNDELERARTIGLDSRAELTLAQRDQLEAAQAAGKSEKEMNKLKRQFYNERLAMLTNEQQLMEMQAARGKELNELEVEQQKQVARDINKVKIALIELNKVQDQRTQKVQETAERITQQYMPVLGQERFLYQTLTNAIDILNQKAVRSDQEIIAIKRAGVKELLSEEEAAEKLRDTRAQRRVDRVKATLQGIADIVSLFSGKSEKAQKRAFDINKKAQMGTAIIDGAVAVQKALSSAPPPLNFILAGFAAAAALVQVKKISEQQFQSATSPVSGGGSAPAMNSSGAGPGTPGAPPIFGTPQSTDLTGFGQNQGQSNGG
ncbi:MAG: hypothetical protein EB116_18215, partial [Betaproteobacteria bacterium]|nr:hypothetical protein [Betaproteobacteria bacterium]